MGWWSTGAQTRTCDFKAWRGSVSGLARISSCFRTSCSLLGVGEDPGVGLQQLGEAWAGGGVEGQHVEQEVAQPVRQTQPQVGRHLLQALQHPLLCHSHTVTARPSAEAAGRSASSPGSAACAPVSQSRAVTGVGHRPGQDGEAGKIYIYVCLYIYIYQYIL